MIHCSEKPDMLCTSHIPPNTAEAEYNIFYSGKLSLSSSTAITKRFYCVLMAFFFFWKTGRRENSINFFPWCIPHFTAAARGKLFHRSNLKFSWFSWSLSSLDMDKKGQSLLSVQRSWESCSWRSLPKSPPSSSRLHKPCFSNLSSQVLFFKCSVILVAPLFILAKFFTLTQYF